MKSDGLVPSTGGATAAQAAIPGKNGQTSNGSQIQTVHVFFCSKIHFWRAFNDLSVDPICLGVPHWCEKLCAVEWGAFFGRSEKMAKGQKKWILTNGAPPQGLQRVQGPLGPQLGPMGEIWHPIHQVGPLGCNMRNNRSQRLHLLQNQTFLVHLVCHFWMDLTSFQRAHEDPPSFDCCIKRDSTKVFPGKSEVRNPKSRFFPCILPANAMVEGSKFAWRMIAQQPAVRIQVSSAQKRAFEQIF